jgi:hypothetical protein
MWHTNRKRVLVSKMDAANGRTVSSVWERSVDWLRQNLRQPPEAAATSSVSEPATYASVPGGPFELWQQAQGLVSSSGVGDAGLGGSAHPASIEQHRQQLDTVIASFQMLRQAMDDHAGAVSPPVALEFDGDDAGWWEDSSDDTCSFTSESSDQAGPEASNLGPVAWKPLAAALGNLVACHDVAASPVATGAQVAVPDAVLRPPPPPYSHGAQCASCLHHFESDKAARKPNSVCTRPFSRSPHLAKTTVRGFPPGYSLCMPCYKVRRRCTHGRTINTAGTNVS